jgi:S1-C subfamily serine protease
MPRARVLSIAILAAAALGAGIALAVTWAAGGFDKKTPVPLRTTASAPIAAGGFSSAWAERLYATRVGSVVSVFPGSPNGAQALGAGFVIDAARGYVVTNSHVVTNSSEMGVTPSGVRPLSTVFIQRSDQARTPAQVVGWDLFDDVAVLHYDPGSLEIAQAPVGDSLHLRVGAWVAAIGAPFGAVESLSVGVVSQIHTQIVNPASLCFRTADAIQTDAAVNPGNSGGPLFDQQGEVVGVTSQILGPSKLDANAGVAFAVPIEAVMRSARQIIKTGGTANPSWLGVGAVTLTPDIVAQYHLKATYGAQLTFVEPGSAAQKAGLSAGPGLPVAVNGRNVYWRGDVITSADGHAIRSLYDLQGVLAPLAPGARVRLVWYHAGRTRRTGTVSLIRRDPNDKYVCQATAGPP